MGSKGLDRRNLLNQAMSDGTCNNKRGIHEQQEGVQEFMQKTSKKLACTGREQERKTSGKTRRKFKDKKTRSIF